MKNKKEFSRLASSDLQGLRHLRRYRSGENGSAGTILIIAVVVVALVFVFLAIKIGPHYFTHAKLKEALESDDFALAYRKSPSQLTKKVVLTARDLGLSRIEGHHVTLEYGEQGPPSVDIYVEYSVLQEVIPGLWTWQHHFEAYAHSEKSGVANFIDETGSEVEAGIKERFEGLDDYMEQDDFAKSDGSGTLTVIDSDEYDDDSYDDEDEGQVDPQGQGRRGLTGYAEKARRAVR